MNDSVDDFKLFLFSDNNEDDDDYDDDNDDDDDLFVAKVEYVSILYLIGQLLMYFYIYVICIAMFNLRSIADDDGSQMCNKVFFSKGTDSGNWMLQEC